MAHTSASGPVLAAIVAQLAHASYTGAVAGKTVTVTNHPVATTAAPFSVVAIASEVRDDSMGQAGKSVLARITHYSDAEGDRELLAMRAAVWARLHYAALTVTGHVLVACTVDQGMELEPVERAGAVRRAWVDVVRVDVRQTA